MDTDVDLSLNSEPSLIALPSLQNRYILAQVGQQQIAFPSQWVAEILLVERSQILSLPFYDPTLLGLIYHQGQIVPLISAYILLSEGLDQEQRLRAMQETLTIVHLGQAAEQLAGVGLVVEEVVSNTTTQPLSTQRVFQFSDMPGHIWQPRC
jgi:chemotaxis signal transduction protein